MTKTRDTGVPGETAMGPQERVLRTSSSQRFARPPLDTNGYILKRHPKSNLDNDTNSDIIIL
jgi:hypothetical protein